MEIYAKRDDGYSFKVTKKYNTIVFSKKEEVSNKNLPLKYFNMYYSQKYPHVNLFSLVDLSVINRIYLQYFTSKNISSDKDTLPYNTYFLQLVYYKCIKTDSNPFETCAQFFYSIWALSSMINYNELLKKLWCKGILLTESEAYLSSVINKEKQGNALFFTVNNETIQICSMKGKETKILIETSIEKISDINTSALTTFFTENFSFLVSNRLQEPKEDLFQYMTDNFSSKNQHSQMSLWKYISQKTTFNFLTNKSNL